MTEEPVTFGDVERARWVIGERLHRTPTFGSRRTSERAGCTVFLKAELFQRTGSFKPRGVLNKLATLTPAERKRGVVTASSGNHAQALAYCAAAEGIDCLVVMPKDASEQKVRAARSYGASVDQESGDGAEAIERAETVGGETGRILIPAFDDPAIIAGQGTIGLELLEQVPDLDVIVVPVSGGGLVSGIAVAVRNAKPEARIVAVESSLAPTLARAMEAGRPVAIDSHTVADGLGAPAVGELCLAICRRHVEEIVQVSDDEIIDAMRWIYENAKLACEPAGAAALAALLEGRVQVDQETRAAVIVSGGNIELNAAAKLLGAERELERTSGTLVHDEH
jgi:threonine dehydratase